MKERISKIKFVRLMLVSSILVFIIVSYGTLGLRQVKAAPAEDTIRIGVIMPLTGMSSRWGTFDYRGAMLAGRQINDTGGLLGKKVEIIPGDSQGIPAEGVSAAHRMINRDKVILFVAAQVSSVTKALQPVVEEAKIPMVAAASSDPEITYKAGVGGFKWTFRNYPTEELRSLIILEYAIKQKGFAKFSFIAVDNDYGRSAVAFSQKYLPRFPGVQFATIDYFGLKETDFRPVLSKIKAAGSQVIMLYTLAADTVRIIGRQMQEFGLAGKVRLMGMGDITHPDTVKSLGEVVEGAVEGTLWLSKLDAPRSKQFIEDYQKMWGEEPNFLAYSYWETTHLVAQAIKNANSIKNEDIYSALKAIKYETILGTVWFDDHNQSNTPLLLVEIVNGNPVIKGKFWSKMDYPKK